MMEREGKMLRGWPCDQLVLKCEGKADSDIPVVDVFAYDHFV